MIKNTKIDCSVSLLGFVMKKISIIFLFIWVLANVGAQDSLDDFKKQAQQEYKGFKKQAEKEFNDFRDQANAEYAEFMRQSWEEFRAFAGIPVPKSPEPLKPPVVDPDKEPTADPIPYKEVVPVPRPVMPPQPLLPIPPAPQPVKPALSFLFYGTECNVRLEPHQKIALPDLSENRISDAWKQ
jgi:hypothetical protein